MTADGTLCAPTTVDTSHPRRRMSSARVLDSAYAGMTASRNMNSQRDLMDTLIDQITTFAQSDPDIRAVILEGLWLSTRMLMNFRLRRQRLCPSL